MSASWQTRGRHNMQAPGLAHAADRAERTRLPVVATVLLGLDGTRSGTILWVGSDVVWWPGAPMASRDRVAVVSVSITPGN